MKKIKIDGIKLYTVFVLGVTFYWETGFYELLRLFSSILPETFD